MIPIQGTKLTLAQVDELAEPLGYLAFELFIEEKIRRDNKSARASLERLAFVYSFAQTYADFLTKDNGLLVISERKLQAESDIPSYIKPVKQKAQWKTDKGKFGFKRK